jgi:hypothetical protein
MDREHKQRLLTRLDALKKAVEENDIHEDILEAVYTELNAIDKLFPEGIKTHSVLELKGLGKEFWRSIDVDEYIRKERDSWR